MRSAQLQTSNSGSSVVERAPIEETITDSSAIDRTPFYLLIIELYTKFEIKHILFSITQTEPSVWQLKASEC